MKCTNCGKEVANDALFCSFCGTKIERNEVSPNLNQTEENASSHNSKQNNSSNEGKTEEKNSDWKKFFKILLWGVLIIGIFKYCVNSETFKALTMSEEEQVRSSIQEALNEMQLPIELMEGMSLTQVSLRDNDIVYIVTIPGIRPQMFDVNEEALAEVKDEIADLLRVQFQMTGGNQDFVKSLKKFGYYLVYKVENEYGTELFRINLSADDLMGTRPRMRSQSSVQSSLNKLNGSQNTKAPNGNSSVSNKRRQNQPTSNDIDTGESAYLAELQTELLAIRAQLPIKLEDDVFLTAASIKDKCICFTIRIDVASETSINKETENLLRTIIIATLKEGDDKSDIIKMKKYGFYYSIILTNKDNWPLTQFSIPTAELLQ